MHRTTGVSEHCQSQNENTTTVDAPTFLGEANVWTFSLLPGRSRRPAPIHIDKHPNRCTLLRHTMTRYTNVGRKRTYLQASFDPNDDQNVASTSSPPSPDVTPSHTSNGTGAARDAPAEPSRKRRRKSNRNSEENVADGSGPPAADAEGGSGKNPRATKSEKAKKALAKLKAKEKAKRVKSAYFSLFPSLLVLYKLVNQFDDGDNTHALTHLTAAADRATSTQARRLKRIAERHAHTTCFACREVGHSAKDCPTVTRPEDDGDDGGATKTGTTAAAAVVGICYRCGSRKHNLARCRKPPVRPDDPLPFASCFVCSGRGHLAGSCPKNDGKGVYPNGGSCKLCGETTHLARDCTLRKISSSAFPYPPPPPFFFFLISKN